MNVRRAKGRAYTSGDEMGTLGEFGEVIRSEGTSRDNRTKHKVEWKT